MPIYDISELKEETQDIPLEESALDAPPDTSKDRFFSSITARTLFLLLLIGDIAWATWTTLKISLLFSLFCLTLGRSCMIKSRLCKAWVALKRAGVCGVSLLIAIFSPALGIIVACTYFLMYDKAGIQEVVPQSLQGQFQDFLKESK
jgi:hypothetical protein